MEDMTMLRDIEGLLSELQPSGARPKGHPETQQDGALNGTSIPWSGPQEGSEGTQLPQAQDQGPDMPAGVASLSLSLSFYPAGPKQMGPPFELRLCSRFLRFKSEFFVASGRLSACSRGSGFGLCTVPKDHFNCSWRYMNKIELNWTDFRMRTSINGKGSNELPAHCSNHYSILIMDKQETMPSKFSGFTQLS